jgi:hypothetical protein
MKIRQRWLSWVLLVVAAVVIGSALGFGLRWWQQSHESPAPPRYRVVLERPLNVKGVSTVLVILHLGSGEDPVRVARHYLQNQAAKADLYQLVTPYGNVLALRAATFPNPEKLPDQVRQRLVPWERATSAGRAGPYTLYRLERGS